MAFMIGGIEKATVRLAAATEQVVVKMEEMLGDFHEITGMLNDVRSAIDFKDLNDIILMIKQINVEDLNKIVAMLKELEISDANAMITKTREVFEAVEAVNVEGAVDHHDTEAHHDVGDHDGDQ